MEHVHDENCDHEHEQAIVLTDDAGNDVVYHVMDLVPYQDKEYLILLEDGNEEEGLVTIVEVVAEPDSEEVSEVLSVEDEDVLQNVFEIFKERNDL